MHQIGNRGDMLPRPIGGSRLAGPHVAEPYRIELCFAPLPGTMVEIIAVEGSLAGLRAAGDDPRIDPPDVQPPPRTALRCQREDPLICSLQRAFLEPISSTTACDW